MPNTNTCPCSPNSAYSDCCQPYIEGTLFPDTAEKLMRSRYSAFVIENEDYLLNSWHPDHRPTTIGFDKDTKWLGLKVISSKQGRQTDNEGWVSFVARYKIAGKASRIEEYSHFVRLDNHWVYCRAEEPT